MKNSVDQTANLYVIAKAPFNNYYEGVAEIVSATNSVGRFDILPGHADFFSIISSGDVVIQTPKEELTINVNNGIITVRDNQVMLFLNI